MYVVFYFQKYLTSLIKPLYTRLDFDDNETDSYHDIRLRMYAREWACKLDIADCRFKAAKYFLEKTRNSKP